MVSEELNDEGRAVLCRLNMSRAVLLPQPSFAFTMSCPYGS
jgi:hypothetical protein